MQANNLFSLPVIELFTSIQGEGFFMGTAATFVRLDGCNLKCPWCDTKVSWTDFEGEKNVEHLSFEAIVKKCEADMVVITGGEPCMHKDLSKLIDALHEADKYVCIETNGTLPTPGNADWVTVSPKPGKYTIDPDCNPSEIKFVVSDELNFVKHVLPILQDVDVPVWLQPEGSDMYSAAKKAYDLVLQHQYENLRVGIQMHKIFKFQ
jgi:organic radical activating enzyme